MGFTLALVAVLVATAAALPAPHLEDIEASRIRKSREIGVDFGISGSLNDGSFGYSPYQYYPAYQQYYRPYNNYPGTYYEGYGRPYYGGYYGRSRNSGYNGIGASIGFGFGAKITNNPYDYEPGYYADGPYGYSERWRLFD